jgi:hypothetical protein
MARFIESAFEEMISAEDLEFEIESEGIRKDDSPLSGEHIALIVYQV